MPSENGKKSKAHDFYQYFEELFDRYSKLSEIGYEVISYDDFQSDSFVRKILLDIIDRESEFKHLLNPADNILKFRFRCDLCNFQEKSVKTREKIRQDGKYDVTYATDCFKHGIFESTITPDNNTFVDMNTPLRSVIRKAKLIEDSREQDSLNIMVDGSDWCYITPILSQGLHLLGYGFDGFLERIFSPLVVDWSGAKFSKSIYVKKETYKGIPQGFINYKTFLKEFGDDGFLKLWDEIQT
ncbi:MAG: hypothetical protein U9O53_02410 [archaeon]|nr:hypothetical protein [archaeon]